MIAFWLNREEAMAIKHIEHLEKLRTRLRRERRALAEAVASASASAVDRRDLIEFGQLQRSFEAVDDAIEDENKEAEAEAARIRLANKPEPPRYDTDDTDSLDHDAGPK